MNTPKEPYKGIKNILQNLEEKNEELLNNLDNTKVSKEDEEDKKHMEDEEDKAHMEDENTDREQPYDYPHIDEMEHADLRNWNIRQQIKDETTPFRQECSSAITNKNQRAIEKIVEIIKKALIEKHYDDTNSPYFINACNDIFAEIKKHTWRDYYEERNAEVQKQRQKIIENEYPEVFELLKANPDDPIVKYIINRYPYQNIDEALAIIIDMMNIKGKA